MENSNDNIYKPIEPKTLAYDYLFNYFGKDTFKGKIIVGASIQLAIRAYKDKQEIRFMEEPKYESNYFCDNYQVSFDREKLFFIKKNLKVDNLFRIAFGWDNIESEVVGYTLDFIDTPPEKILKDLPEQFKNIPCSTPMEVSENEFRNFLSNNIDEFDISDNKNAQVPAVSYI